MTKEMAEGFIKMVDDEQLGEWRMYNVKSVTLP